MMDKPDAKDILPEDQKQKIEGMPDHLKDPLHNINSREQVEDKIDEDKS